MSARTEDTSSDSSVESYFGTRSHFGARRPSLGGITKMSDGALSQFLGGERRHSRTRDGEGAVSPASPERKEADVEAQGGETNSPLHDLEAQLAQPAPMQRSRSAPGARKSAPPLSTPPKAWDAASDASSPSSRASLDDGFTRRRSRSGGFATPERSSLFGDRLSFLAQEPKVMRTLSGQRTRSGVLENFKKRPHSGRRRILSGQASLPSDARCFSLPLWLLEPEPSTLIWLFILTNNLTYLDRGIFPGAAPNFLTFIRNSEELSGTENANLYLGLLQTATIVGVSLWSTAAGAAATRMSPMRLVSVGLFIWCGAALLAALSEPLESYSLLIFSRVVSGAGEAAMQVVATPYIRSMAKDYGVKLGYFFTGLVSGTSLGYVMGFALTELTGYWAAAYVFEVFLVLPVALYCYNIPASVTLAVGMTSERRLRTFSIHLKKERESDLQWTESIEALDLANLSSEDLHRRKDSLEQVQLDPVPPSDPVFLNGNVPKRTQSGKFIATEEEPPPPPPVADEFRTILSKPLFIMVAFGYAAYAGTVTGYRYAGAPPRVRARAN